MDYGDIARQAREREDDRQRGYELAVQKQMQDLGISREFAEYLLNLETKIRELERRLRKRGSETNPVKGYPMEPERPHGGPRMYKYAGGVASGLQGIATKTASARAFA